MNRENDIDVLVLGGGIAGLWVLNALQHAGYGAILVETGALGTGQTLQSQGIIHGGDKYRLQAVGDFNAAQALVDMPRRWSDSLEGHTDPDLRTAKIRSRSCYMWTPKLEFANEMTARESVSGVLEHRLPATLTMLPSNEWPEALLGSALEVGVMPELVVDVASVLSAFQEQHKCKMLFSRKLVVEPDAGEVVIEGCKFRPQAIVLAAGDGNEGLLQSFGATPRLMQRRPLRMFLLRGRLPALYGHCVIGGKTHLTITSVRSKDGEIVWQIGGELAERSSGLKDLHAARRDAITTLRLLLPSVNFEGAEVASYSAVRTEGATADGSRPSNVYLEVVHRRPKVLAVWPTKLALAPLLADQVVARLSGSIAATGSLPSVPTNREDLRIAATPWEKATWFPVQ